MDPEDVLKVYNGPQRIESLRVEISFCCRRVSYVEIETTSFRDAGEVCRNCSPANLRTAC